MHWKCQFKIVHNVLKSQPYVIAFQPVLTHTLQNVQRHMTAGVDDVGLRVVQILDFLLGIQQLNVTPEVKIKSDMEILAYFFAPLGLLLLINLFLFAATAWELTCGLWKTEVVKASTERAALGRVCVKLVIMMGLTWVLDIISWAVGGPSYLWYLPDLLNTLQGVFIFIVVGCHPQVWAAVKRNCLGERTNRTLARHQLSSVSQASRSALDTTNTTKIIPLETMC
uniref:(California timema) hypothetical protein n=1 Tax=Timema californicum TaxID=61474 RepID=A0A7R9P2D5_TIMCA|nr:unnamed protein product [Timema californicum]